MLENIKQGERVVRVEYSLSFVWEHDVNGGFGFPCNEAGEILPGHFDDRPTALANYLDCLAGVDERGYKILPAGVKRYESSYWEPTRGTCPHCGTEVQLYDTLFNECDGCGTGYSGTGQELAPVEQWEPEDVYDTFGPRGYEDW